jgi:hypothetical protein
LEAVLNRVVGWIDVNADLRIHMLGWLATRADDQIMEEALEMVGALENVAYTNTITKMGEDILTNVVELCTILTTKGPDNLTTCNTEGDNHLDIGQGQQTQGCQDLYPGHHKVGELHHYQ